MAAGASLPLLAGSASKDSGNLSVLLIGAFIRWPRQQPQRTFRIQRTSMTILKRPGFGRVFSFGNAISSAKHIGSRSVLSDRLLPGRCASCATIACKTRSQPKEPGSCMREPGRLRRIGNRSRYPGFMRNFTNEIIRSIDLQIVRFC